MTVPASARQVLPLLALASIIAAAIAARPLFPWIAQYPEAWTVPAPQWVGQALTWLVALAKPLSRCLSAALTWPMTALRDFLIWLPAPVFICLSCLAAYLAAGWRTLVLTLVSLVYIAIAGYWVQSMNTLALVCLAILIASVGGFALGVWAHRDISVRRLLDPLLDFMQTIPTFAYLIPILLLFGFGPIVGLISSAIFAAPPMVRNTLLGLQRVPQDLHEAGLISGCSPAQQFWWVEVPAALPQIKLGINQTTMAAFAMVIISAIIGGFNDIGWEVLSSIRRANFGESALSGLVIALLAISLDRISLGLAAHGNIVDGHNLSRRQSLAAVAAALLFGWTLSLMPSFGPQGNLKFIADSINGALSYVTSNYAEYLNELKSTLLYFVILPVKIGLENVVTPYTWGFALTGWPAAIYWLLVAATAIGLARYFSIPAGAIAFILGSFLYVGTTGMPWIGFLVAITLCAYWSGGRRNAIFALSTLLFILIAGQWQQAMISIYLCSTAVVVSVVVGMALGVWGAASDRASTVLRQINDVLQTVPQFVFLIPALMLFGVGDFTGLLAIILYAIVPIIRYTEHGLRQVPSAQVEAGISMGCTPSQIFWQVKLPYSFPEILLGINQTILFAMGMLVIASLVGTDGLGQQIYIGLGKNDPGLGIVAGFSLAFIGMVADRILRSASASKKAALGLA
jgi:glycine betaine/proline transport system permease protein